VRQNDYLEIHVGVLEGIACKRHGKCWKNENNLIKWGVKKCIVLLTREMRDENLQYVAKNGRSCSKVCEK
jgi:hypothetical protein